MLAAGNRVRVDSHKGENTHGRSLHALAVQVDIVAQLGGRSLKRAQDRDRGTSRATRGIDGKIGGIKHSLDARAILTPIGQTLTPAIG